LYNFIQFHDEPQNGKPRCNVIFNAFHVVDKEWNIYFFLFVVLYDTILSYSNQCDKQVM